jgi:hypothetical protein
MDMVSLTGGVRHVVARLLMRLLIPWNGRDHGRGLGPPCPGAPPPLPPHQWVSNETFWHSERKNSSRVSAPPSSQPPTPPPSPPPGTNWNTGNGLHSLPHLSRHGRPGPLTRYPVYCTVLQPTAAQVGGWRHRGGWGGPKKWLKKSRKKRSRLPQTLIVTLQRLSLAVSTGGEPWPPGAS